MRYSSLCVAATGTPSLVYFCRPSRLSKSLGNFNSTTAAGCALKKESGSDAVTDLWCKMVVFDVLYASTEEDDVASKSDISTTTDIFYGCYPALVTKYRSFTTP
jgi:hypothetical protein